MKYFLALTVLALPNIVHAKFTGPSDKPMISTIAEVKDSRDDTKVILDGVIEKQTKKEHYLFNDGKNTITVEIDNDVWRGLDVSEKDKVRIFGEVAHSMFHDTKIEVEAIEIIK